MLCMPWALEFWKFYVGYQKVANCQKMRLFYRNNIVKLVRRTLLTEMQEDVTRGATLQPHHQPNHHLHLPSAPLNSLPKPHHDTLEFPLRHKRAQNGQLLLTSELFFLRTMSLSAVSCRSPPHPSAKHNQECWGQNFQLRTYERNATI